MAERRLTPSARVALWIGVLAAVLVALAGGAAVFRSVRNDPQTACVETGGVWNAQLDECEATHGAEAAGR